MDSLHGEEMDTITVENKKHADIAPVHRSTRKYDNPNIGSNSIWDQSNMKVKNDESSVESSDEVGDANVSDWLWGGNLGDRGTMLFFRSCALASKEDQFNESTNDSENTSIPYEDPIDHPFGPSVTSWDSDDFDTNSETDGELENGCDNKRKRNFEGILCDINNTDTVPNIYKPSMMFRQRLTMNSKSSSLPCSINNLDTLNINKTNKMSKSMEQKNVIVPDRKKMPAAILNVKYKTAMAETRLLSKMLHAHGFTDVEPNSKDFNLMWSGLHPKPDVLRSLTSYQRVNHFPRSYELTRKDKLFKNIEKMQYVCGAKNFDFIPLTFIMPIEFKELCSVHYRIKGPWIVKPAASSRGRGIYIVNTPDQIPKGESVVVAKYIDKPLLVDGHKCDLRLYVCVTSFDPLLIYMYEEGLVRFATVKYDKSNKSLWNPCMHLCNYSINKYHSDYVKCDDPSVENVGHKWTLSALLRRLRNQGYDTAALMSSIEDVVVKSILSCTQSIASASKMFVPYFSNCFELYGFDILIDEALKPWLLEINLSPSLGCDSPLDVRLKSALLADTLNLVGIPAVDPCVKVETAHRTCRSVNLKMRIKGCRRVHSAENMSSKRKGFSVSGGNSINGVDYSSLSNEEIRIIKLVKAQYKRRGGFVRIFPSQDSWKKYGQYLDPITGVPICSLSMKTSSSLTTFGSQNYNLLVHMHVIPNFDQAVISNNSQNEPPERLKRYERILPACTKVTLDSKVENTAPRKVTGSAGRKTHLDTKIAKYHLKQQIEKGSQLTMGEYRRTFSTFLLCVLRRISNSTSDQAIQHADLILRFLKKVSHTLKMPYTIKNPASKMSDKDKAAVIAKQLNDFLHIYHRETDICSDAGDKNQNANFNQFICSASEADLEEILLTVLKQEGNVIPFLGDRTSQMCVDMPPSQVNSQPKDTPLRHQLLRYLAYVTPVHSRRFKQPSPERGTTLPPLNVGSDKNSKCSQSPTKSGK